MQCELAEAVPWGGMEGDLLGFPIPEEWGAPYREWRHRCRDNTDTLVQAWKAHLGLSPVSPSPSLSLSLLLSLCLSVCVCVYV